MAIGIARELIGRGSGNMYAVVTFEAILDSISPQRPDEEQDKDRDDRQDNMSHAARARRTAGINERAILRGALVRVWRIVSAMEELFGHQAHDAAIRGAKTNAQMSEKDDRIVELTAESEKKSRMLTVHENCNNPSRTGHDICPKKERLSGKREREEAGCRLEGYEQW